MTDASHFTVPVPSGYRVGDWEVREPLASGAFGSVYAARAVDGSGDAALPAPTPAAEAGDDTARDPTAAADAMSSAPAFPWNLSIVVPSHDGPGAPRGHRSVPCNERTTRPAARAPVNS
ncbi:hypothetical protein ACFYXH_01715 [Streptomyces sp. NPDC002730]|uniref:hypothetical protein n=1 Tax=Streptomyces sp. NPDC002730 TaxID=3364662 RepID=UPI00368ACEAF